MREDESNWFSRWEEQLPSPEELMPLSQTLITPDLALAFDIRNPNNNNSNNHLIITNNNNSNHHHHHHHGSQTPPTPPLPPPPLQQPNNSSSVGPPMQQQQQQPNNSSEFDNSGDLGSGGVGGDEPARTLKRPRLVWTPQLHKRFVDAVAHLGIKNAVPKTIMQLMSVDGLTRENVASHLQKYRLYLKRMQGLSGGGGGGGGGGNGASDPATDHLFASSPVPPHFLHPTRPNSDHFLPFVPVAALQHHHHHHHHQQQMAAAAAAVGHPQLQQQYHQHRQVGHFGSPPNGQFEHPFLTRQSQQPLHRMGAPVHNSMPAAYVEDLESGTPTGGRKVLTLFPTGDD